MSTQRTAHVPINNDAPNSFQRMEKLLYREDGKFVSGRKVARNTYLERRGGVQGLALKLHNTDIITWYPDNTVELNSGGWLTTTTRTRMNDWLPRDEGSGRCAQIFSDRGYWMVSFKSHADRDNSGGNRHVPMPELDTVPYHDGLVIDLTTLTEFSPRYDDSEDRAWNAQVDKALAAYLKKVKGVDKGLAAGPGGDMEKAKRVLANALGLPGGNGFPSQTPELVPKWMVESLRAFGIRSNTNIYTPRRIVSSMQNEVWSEATMRLLRDDLRKLFRGVLYQGYHSRKIVRR